MSVTSTMLSEGRADNVHVLPNITDESQDEQIENKFGLMSPKDVEQIGYEVNTTTIRKCLTSLLTSRASSCTNFALKLVSLGLHDICVL